MRTNNPLERFNRTLNDTFARPHPNLIEFVAGIEGLARRAETHLQDVARNLASAPRRLEYDIPIAVELPDEAEESDDEQLDDDVLDSKCSDTSEDEAESDMGGDASSGIDRSNAYDHSTSLAILWSS